MYICKHRYIIVCMYFTPSTRPNLVIKQLSRDLGYPCRDLKTLWTMPKPGAPRNVAKSERFRSTSKRASCLSFPGRVSFLSPSSPNTTQNPGNGWVSDPSHVPLWLSMPVGLTRNSIFYIRYIIFCTQYCKPGLNKSMFLWEHWMHWALFHSTPAEDQRARLRPSAAQGLAARNPPNRTVPVVLWIITVHKWGIMGLYSLEMGSC